MAQVNWLGSNKKDLVFCQLNIGDTFKYNGSRSQGAVYMKVIDRHSHAQGLELATGNLYPVMEHSPVEKVDVVININSTKPSV